MPLLRKQSQNTKICFYKEEVKRLSKQDILQELNSMLLENFNVKVFEPQKSLFSSEVGLYPRDLVKLVMLTEHKYNIRFSESELSGDKIDCPEEIASIIYTHLSY